MRSAEGAIGCRIVAAPNPYLHPSRALNFRRRRRERTSIAAAQIANATTATAATRISGVAKAIARLASSVIWPRICIIRPVDSTDRTVVISVARVHDLSALSVATQPDVNCLPHARFKSVYYVLCRSMQFVAVHRLAVSLTVGVNTMAGKSHKKSAKVSRRGDRVNTKATNSNKTQLSPKQVEELLRTLQARFEKNMNRHKGLEWAKVQAKLEGNTEKLWSLYEMERTGGEPDVAGHDKKAGEYIFYDCSAESPNGRRSVCYDREGLETRKENKPENSAIDMAAAMGIELLTEEQYRELQKLGDFDTKTSSWVKTPADIRKLGGALFCDRRYGNVFVYHNGAQSYYAARAFRGSLRV